ncbi:MAG: TolC family protein [Planctomycetes bacterium]|nr:TolC family protein [Planctomycetota bacterium]
MLILLASALSTLSGCKRTRSEHRVQADEEVYDTIAERNLDPRWRTPNPGIEINPRSRYFDPCDPDRPPMPQDDPASHQYMRRVDGRKGWKHWADNGTRTDLENPAWREALGDYVDVDKDGTVELTVDSTLQLAYVHSPSLQSQLETLYLSALDVTAERFRLSTQYFGGYDAIYNASDAGRDQSLTLGKDPVLQAQRRTATAADLLVGFANSFSVEFSGGGTNFATSLAQFSFVQPLLRGAGRDVALEQLTLVERVLLANVRAFHQYRQGFYTQVTIGELGVAGLRRGGSSTAISGFSGQGGVGGYIGLLEQLQRKRNTEGNLSLQERTLARLVAFQDIGVIDMVQVDQFLQSIQSARASLLGIHNSYELALDRYKTGTLGLPPNLPIELDDSLIRQFQLVSPEATALEDGIVELQDRVGVLSDDAGSESIGEILAGAAALLKSVQQHLEDVTPDLERMEEAAPMREQVMNDTERDEFRSDRQGLHQGLADLETQFGRIQGELEILQGELSVTPQKETFDHTVIWLTNTLRLVQGAMLIQARARLEIVGVEAITLDPEAAFATALGNRMDFMNGRAALVDSWRTIQLCADALQSRLNVVGSGSIGTAGNNATDFRSSTSNLRLGVEFDAPLTRLLERNNYRQSLINYQRSRRSFIQSHDSLHLGLRGLLRQIEQLRTDLEIQRRAVTIAIRQVDMTRATFYAPVRPPQPGQRPAQFGPTAAQRLLDALANLRTTQNSFMRVWLNYYAARMRLDRELGTMALDAEGRWTEQPASSTPVADVSDMDASTVPPALPDEWIELANALENVPDVQPPDPVQRSGRATELRPDQYHAPEDLSQGSVLTQLRGSKS